jgi:undecaprenyl-diphosphatase
MIRKALTFTFLIISLCTFTLYGENFDEYISRRIREDLSSPCMDKVMNGFTEIGSNEAASLILLSMYTLGDDNMQDAAKLSTFSIAGATLTCALIKFTVNRERPCGSPNRLNSSFPSGHATGAFAFSYVIGKRYPKAAIPLYLISSTVAISRVYNEKHYLSDVMAGAILGIVSGWVVMKNEQNILKNKI